MTPPRKTNPVQRTREGFIPASKEALLALYSHYRKRGPAPFLMDIYEPMPFLTKNRFVRFFSEQAAVWVRTAEVGFTEAFFLHDFQPEHRLANLDFFFVDGIPSPSTERAGRLWGAVRAASRRQKLTRVQSFVLASDEGRIALLKSYGFESEGVLREHLFFDGKMRDVAVFARLERGRA